jgi:hypothetical protein
MTNKLGSGRIRRKKTRSNRIRRKKTSGVRRRRLSGKLRRNIILRGGMDGRPGWATLEDPKEQLRTYDTILDGLLELSGVKLLEKYESGEVRETQAELMAICKDGVGGDEAFQREAVALMEKSGKLTDKILSIAGGMAADSESRLKSTKASVTERAAQRDEQLMAMSKRALARTQARLESAATQEPAPEPAPARTKKQKPNAPCACGSGKKYKKCHGRE